ncbi:hypothetical protein GH714_008531 [Hevea brasiliensis]|uniref:Uncharacterized protein n=1 Tax=Hevea brasiliensis TaxID=3981 RepID=A0A6A6LMZ1_HEVBR|nr:hypothetical protein GH714_008531 [Hevea brasiliensis]
MKFRRNDGLQEELAKVSIELAQLSKDREDLEFLQNLESGMKSCLNRAESDLVVRVPLFSAYDGINSSILGNKGNFMAVDFSSETNMLEHLEDDFISEVCSSLQEFIKEIATVNIILHEHSATFHEKANSLSKLMGSIHRDMSSQKESFEAMKQDIRLIESTGKEKEMEIVALHRNIALLYEACASLLLEIENRKAEVVTNSLAVRDLGLNLKPATFGDGGLPFGGDSNFSSEEHVKTMAEKLLLAMTEFASLKGEIIEGKEKEMKITISNLQKELQEKDIQRERICKDLVRMQMDDLTKKVEELGKVVQQKNLDIEKLEASRGKVVKKLYTTVSRFDELHLFSESLLAEVEQLQSQLQDRDAEISFLRQEVTRCTNDALVASQTSNKRNSDELYELLTWLVAVVSLDVNLTDSSQVHEYKEIIQKKITSILSELEDLRETAQSRDALLQIERSKVDDLTRREEILEKSLHEKESQLNMLEVGRDMEQPTSASSEILEVEPVVNKWTVPGPSTASQVRSLRKVNNDQVAIAIDMAPGSTSTLEDEDDEKAHGFKSLTSSRIVPKFTRPVTDMIDGLWVSCDRALMRQPALRLSIMIYWAVLHALLQLLWFDKPNWFPYILKARWAQTPVQYYASDGF